MSGWTLVDCDAGCSMHVENPMSDARCTVKTRSWMLDVQQTSDGEIWNFNYHSKYQTNARYKKTLCGLVGKIVYSGGKIVSSNFTHMCQKKAKFFGGEMLLICWKNSEVRILTGRIIRSLCASAYCTGEKNEE